MFARIILNKSDMERYIRLAHKSRTIHNDRRDGDDDDDEEDE